VSAQKDGRDVTKESKDRGFTIVFRHDAWLQSIEGNPLPIRTASNSQITLDPLRSPKEFDHLVATTNSSAPHPGVIEYPGIYEIDGDMLKLCFGVESKSRPTEFATKANDGHFFAVLKRVKRKDKSP
jgi:uncharacterized protein (TIGR03067 family)